MLNNEVRTILDNEQKEQPEIPEIIYNGDPVAYAQAWSDFLQMHPEHSFKEYLTTACIKDVCRQFGVRLIDIGMETGAAAFLNAGAADTIALRADIDAVPVGENACHICGHYAHTASLLGTMAGLSGMKESLQHNVLFIFQPAEECTAGAKAMLDAGLWKKVPQKPVRIFGIHNRPELPVGQVAVYEGALMSEKSNWKLHVSGKSGHGGEPHKCIDPMPAAAAFIEGSHTIVSRNLDPNTAAVCSVLSMTCGTPDNFVPEDAYLTGSIRAFDHSAHERMRHRLEALASGIETSYECDMSLTWTLHVPAIDNTPEMTAAAREIVGRDAVPAVIVDTDPALGTDDFAVFQETVPGFYYWVGSGREDGQSPAWHKQGFAVEPGYQNVAVNLLIQSVL